MTTTYGFGFELARPRSRGARLARIDALATLLDTALVIPGTGVRFGLDALIGLVPVVGDIITTALSLFIVHEAYQLGAPGHVIARMLGNVALDGAFGAVCRRCLRCAVAREPAKRAAVTGVAGARAPAVSRVVGRRIAMSIVSLLLNLLWIVFGGLWMALAWVIAAVVMAITIVGLPWARAAFSIAAYTLLPFGYKAVPRDEYFGREDVGTGPLGVIGNVVWLVFVGWWLALGHLVTAILLAVTIVGIPFAWAHLKLAGLALWPIGKAIVPVQT
jgi:uncharacterized membrane protein YccF (DUF307 family)